MITVNSALKQPEIIDLLTAQGFTLRDRGGLSLHFDAPVDLADAAKVAKAAIKATPWGSSIYFTVGG